MHQQDEEALSSKRLPIEAMEQTRDPSESQAEDANVKDNDYVTSPEFHRVMDIALPLMAARGLMAEWNAKNKGALQTLSRDLAQLGREMVNLKALTDAGVATDISKQVQDDQERGQKMVNLKQRRNRRRIYRGVLDRRIEMAKMKDAPSVASVTASSRTSHDTENYGKLTGDELVVTRSIALWSVYDAIIGQAAESSLVGKYIKEVVEAIGNPHVTEEIVHEALRVEKEKENIIQVGDLLKFNWKRKSKIIADLRADRFSALYRAKRPPLAIKHVLEAIAKRSNRGGYVVTNSM